MKWLEVSFNLSGELVEPVADLLARLTPGGVSITQLPREAAEAGVDRLTVAAYLPFDSRLETVKRRLEEGVWHLSQISPIPPPAYRSVEEEDWATAWREHYRPIEVGRRLLIQPAWLGAPANGERLAILIEPGMAFGTGVHPTTRLVLAALEDHLQPGMRVADVGCGSGILAIAAGLLGAGPILALDVDPVAVRVTEQNLEASGIHGSARVELGSLPELQEAVRQSGRGFDVILANILLDVLRALLAGGIAEALAPGGVIILSGILDVQEPDLLEACRDAGLELVEAREEADWRALTLKQKPPPGDGGGENYRR
ncbi:MAG TPA: 50S ribosomal protein L11 methyltransferase [Anaerolineales bacterium]|nr:50S ribosomal protein L11 methyltransferase [Anaerolineales bacterium]